jgi:Glycosyltransferase family 87
MTWPRALPWLLVALAVAVWAGPLQWGWYSDAVITDIGVYRAAADQMLDGNLPYRDFSLEYPPLAGGLFLVVGLVPGDYSIVFQVVMAACLCATVLGVTFTARALGLPLMRQALAGGAVAVSPLLLGNLMESRFDLALAAVLSWMLFAAVTRRWRLMWTLFAAGVLLKLTPLALAPLLVMYHRHHSGTGRAVGGLAAALGGAFVVVAPFLALSPSGTWNIVGYHLDRPLQIEALGSSYLLGLDVIADIPIRVVNSFGSQGLEGRGPDVIAAITSLAVVVLIVAIAIMFTRLLRRASAPADARLLVGATAATTAVFMAGGKVLSPQFLVWLLPSAFLVTGRYGFPAFGLTVAAMVLTQSYFPHEYWDLVALGNTEILLLVLRNLTLVALVAAAWPRRGPGMERAETLPSRPGRDSGSPESAVSVRFLTD